MIAVEFTLGRKLVDPILDAPPDIFVAIALQHVKCLRKSGHMFRVSFFGSIGEIVLIMCQELIKLLSRINPIDAECSWTRRRKLVEHVNELIAIEFEV